MYVCICNSKRHRVFKNVCCHLFPQVVIWSKFWVLAHVQEYDFVTMLLGEDRWLSCLLLKSGWLLDYCSLSEVSTTCPESFDTFFQQRRHWIVSSFANTCSLIKDFRKVRHFNNKLSTFYFAYLIATVFFMIVRYGTKVFFQSSM